VGDPPFSGDRLHFRVKLCLEDGQTCMLSDQTAVTANTTPFIRFVPAPQDPGCSCRQAAAPSALSLGGLGALALAALAVVRRRRPS